MQRSIGLFTVAQTNASLVSSGNLVAPVGMVATATGPGAVHLTWSPSPSLFAAAYEIYRIGDGEPDYTLIATQVGRNNTTYDNGGLMPITAYTYYVVAIHESWSSTPSPTDTVITLP